MRITILHNLDFMHLEGLDRRSQDAVLDVVSAFRRALVPRGVQVSVLPVAEDPVAFVRALREDAPDLVVNLCESLSGEARGEMLVPGLLDLAGLPYTGSGALALALALHKDKAKDLLRGRGVTTPVSGLVCRLRDLRTLDVPLPAIVKPSREDASIGIDRQSVVHDRAALERACRRVLTRYRQPALVEQFIAGRELNVALFGPEPKVLPIAEIDFSGLPADHPRIVTYAAKWDEASPEYHATPPVRCRLPAPLQRRVEQTARAAFQALECRDYARVDIRLSPDGVPYVIEVNPNCDLSPDAGFARAAGLAGLQYDEMVWTLVQMAQKRGTAPAEAKSARTKPTPPRAARRPERAAPRRRRA